MPEVIAKETGEERSTASKLWLSWVRLCLWLHDGLELIFQKIAEAVGKRPFLTLILSLLLVAVLATGMHKYKMEKRSDRLFIPKASRSIKDLEKASAYFTMKFRVGEIILARTDNGDCLQDNIFIEALRLHNMTTSLPDYDNLCLGKILNKNCLQTNLNVLELFSYNAGKIVNVKSYLNTIYKSSSIVMSNGKLAKENFPDMFGDLKLAPNGSVLSAKSIRMAYFMQYHDTDEIYDKIMAWEESFINLLSGQAEILEKSKIMLYYYAHRSLDDSISESALSDLKLIIVAFVLMVVFCVIINLRIRKPVNGHVMLTMGGILAVFLGIGSSFGLVMYTNTPFIGIVAVLPFMVLGVGIDDMFILVDTLDQRHSSLQGNVRLVATLSAAGSSIFMTTLTDLIAFAISTVTDFKGIEYFCVYSALAITFVFILMITFFLALMKLDINRVEAWRYDVIPCQKQEVKQNPWYLEKSNVSTKIMFTWGKILMKTPVRIAVVIVGAGLLAIAVYGTTFLDQSFDSSTLGKDGSYQKNFYDVKRQQFSQGFDVGIFVLGTKNYSNPTTQSQYLQLSEVAMKNEKYLNISSNWLKNYISWSEEKNVSMSGSDFGANLGQFLRDPRYVLHNSHLRFENASDHGSNIIASRVIVRTQSNYHSTFKKDAMLSLRNDIDKLCCLGAFPSTLSFIYYEQFVVILRDTIRNLAVSGLAVLMVTLPYLIHPGVAVLVVFGFVSLVFELLAVMYLWSVSLNSISMIVIVMAIGFSVDYSAHIAHAFTVSTAETPEERVIDALRTMGASVAMGGFSTFLGMLSTAFASSEVFRIFFKMIFTIVILGLLHGLLFLPVYLSVFCRTRIKLPKELTQKEENSKDQMSSPSKHSLCTNQDGSINQTVTGKIGSKVLPVTLALEPVDIDNNKITL